jgi:hypothetical protein
VIKITGVEDVLKKMRTIDKQFNSKIVRPAMTEALKPMQQKAKGLQRHASLRRLIGRRAFVSKKRQEVLGKVFMRPDKKRTIMLEGREVGFEVVANILEFGSVKKNITPQPVMRPARDASQQICKMVLGREIRKRLRAV